MRVLIVGDEGFIGSRIKQVLQDKGILIAGFDKEKGQDLRDWDLVKNTISSFEPDYVVHCAANLNNDTFSCMSNNIIGSTHLFEACSRFGVKKLINFSSAAVYGNSVLPVHELSHRRPINIYGWSKLCVENLLYQYLGKLNFVNLRLSNVYGIGGKGIINKAIVCGKHNKILTLYNNGQSIRDFIFVEDIIKIVMMSINDFEGKNLVGTFNLSTGKETAIIDLINEANKIFRFNVETELGQTLPEIEYSCLNNSKILKATDMEFTNLKEGLELLKKQSI